MTAQISDGGETLIIPTNEINTRVLTLNVELIGGINEEGGGRVKRQIEERTSLASDETTLRIVSAINNEEG